MTNDLPEKKQAVKLTVSMHPDDAEKLIAAFNEGKLKELGVVGIDVPPEIERDNAAAGDWSKRSKQTTEPADHTSKRGR